jgi:hypothetical protein
MSTAIAFDTYAYVRKLRDAGVPEVQAEIQVEAMAALIEERVATRQDQMQLEASLKRDFREMEVKLETRIRELEVKLETGIKELEVKLETGIKELEVKLETEIASVKRDIKELEMRLLLRLGALGVVGIGAIATLIKLL